MAEVEDGTDGFSVDGDLFLVVLNDEEQFSIWPARLPLPAGWTARGEARSRRDCLEHIEAAWTDMRPRSLREAMARAGDDGGVG
jgi:MbtH protein